MGVLLAFSARTLFTPILDPFPVGAVDKTIDPLNPTVAPPAVNAYSGDLDRAMDGDENTHVQLYTYAAGQATRTYDNPVSPITIEVLVGGTTGYSGESGWFGGPGSVTLDGVTLIDFNVPASPVKILWRMLIDGVSGRVLRVNKPGLSRFRVYEIRLFFSP